MERVITLVDKLAKSHVLSREEFSFLLDNIGQEDSYLYEKAREAALANYGNKIYVRGLMEFTNYCKTTATIAVSGEATRRLPDTGCHRSRLWSAAALAMGWDFGPLCFRAARIRGLRMRRLPIWWSA